MCSLHTRTSLAVSLNRLDDDEKLVELANEKLETQQQQQVGGIQLFAI